MTLWQVVRAMEAAALAQPSVKMIVPNDVFRLNTIPDAKYGVFAWTQGLHRATPGEGMHRFAFTLFFVDRLTADKRNELAVQSAGVSTLENILRTLEEQGVFPSGEYTFTTFNQRFTDECAGVFCGVTFDVPVDDMCAEDYTQEEDDNNENNG